MEADLIGEEVDGTLDREDVRDPGRAGDALTFGREPERRAVLGLLDAIDCDRLAAGLDRLIVVAEDEIARPGHDAFADPVGFVLGGKLGRRGQDEHHRGRRPKHSHALAGGRARHPVARRHGAAPPSSGRDESREFRLVQPVRREPQRSPQGSAASASAIRKPSRAVAAVTPALTAATTLTRAFSRSIRGCRRLGDFSIRFRVNQPDTRVSSSPPGRPGASPGRSAATSRGPVEVADDRLVIVGHVGAPDFRVIIFA